VAEVQVKAFDPQAKQVVPEVKYPAAEQDATQVAVVERHYTQ